MSPIGDGAPRTAPQLRGVGQLKRAELAARRSPVELELMHAVKRPLDPAGIMNPGKVVQPG